MSLNVKKKKKKKTRSKYKLYFSAIFDHTLVPEALTRRERERQQKEKPEAKRRASGLGR